MDSKHPGYEHLVVDTVKTIMETMANAWRPHLEDSDGNAQANFLLHVTGSVAASIANNISTASQGCVSIDTVVQDLFYGTTRSIQNYKESLKHARH